MKKSDKPKIKTEGKLTLNISSKFVCLSVKVGTFSNSKQIKDVKEEGEGREALVIVKADAKRVKASKTLLVSPELDALNKHMSQTIGWIKSRCLNTIFKGGLFVLPNGLIDSVEQYCIGADAERQLLIEDAVAAYSQRKEEAKEELRNKEGMSMYNETDYPSEEGFRQCFRFERRYLSFHVPQSLAEISKTLYDREAQKAQEHFKVISDEVTTLLRTTAAGLVDHMVERLTPGADGKRKIFHDTMAEKVKDFVATFDARNITDDAELKEQVEKMGKLMAGVDVDRMRDSEELRERLRADMALIKTGLDKLVINRPSRSYDFGTEE